MTLVLELNDLGVRCYQRGKLLCQSAGVAVADPAAGPPLFGSAAWRQSRLKPLHTYTQFWSQLNTEPLHIQHPLVRHHGDLAYLHLRHLESQLPFAFAGQEVIFALPGSTPRESLGLLLGIANQCGLKTFSFVDTGLASMLAPDALTNKAATDNDQRQTITHVEMFLHHCILTDLQYSDNMVHCTRSEVLSEQGWFNLHTQLLNYFSELFIRQCRFNPRHQASSEQALFDAIPGWLRQSAAQERDGLSRLSCELEQNRVQLDIGSLRQFVQSVWQPLQQKLGQAPRLYVGDRLAQCLPLLALPAGAVTLELQQLTDDLSRLNERISESLNNQPGGVRFIKSLPAPTVFQPRTEPKPETEVQPKAEQPPATHFLYQHSVWPLHGDYTVNLQRQLVRGQSEAILLSVQQGQVDAHQGQLLLNDVAVGQSLNTRSLTPGDRLSLSAGDVQLILVRVEA